MADSQDSWDPETPGSSEEQPSIPVIKQDRKSKKKSSKNKNENKTTKKRKSDETSAGNVNEEQNPTKPEKKSKKRISDEDIPGTSKEETRNPTKTGNKSKKRKSAEDIPGTSKNETHNPTEPGSKSKKRKSAEDKPGTSQDEEPGNPDIEPTKQNGSDMQNSSNPEFKCCKKRCVHNIDSQVRERLHQEYKEQSDRGIEYGRSDLCKYIYPCKLEKDNDGSRRYQYRIPQQVPFDDDDQKNEICQKAFLEIFEMKEHTLRSARRVIDDDQKKSEMKEKPEDDVVYVKTTPATDKQCNCVNSAPIHFNAASREISDQFKGMTNWFLYRIQDNTLEALFSEGYNSVLALQSIAEPELKDLREINAVKRGQITLLRRFVQCLNCRQHPPVYPGSVKPDALLPMQTSVGLMPDRSAVPFTITLPPTDQQHGSDLFADGAGQSTVFFSPGSEKQGENGSSLSESADSPVDLGGTEPLPYQSINATLLYTGTWFGPGSAPRSIPVLAPGSKQGSPPGPVQGSPSSIPLTMCALSSLPNNNLSTSEPSVTYEFERHQQLLTVQNLVPRQVQNEAMPGKRIGSPSEYRPESTSSDQSAIWTCVLENTSPNLLRSFENASPGFRLTLSPPISREAMPGKRIGFTSESRPESTSSAILTRVLENTSPNLLRWLASASQGSVRLTPSPLRDSQ